MGMIEDNTLRIYVVYENPRDMPNHVVVRVTNVRMEPGKEVETKAEKGAVAWSYSDDESRRTALALAPRHCSALQLMPMGRHPNDDPCIVETWI